MIQDLSLNVPLLDLRATKLSPGASRLQHSRSHEVLSPCDHASYFLPKRPQKLLAQTLNVEFTAAPCRTFQNNAFSLARPPTELKLAVNPTQFPTEQPARKFNLPRGDAKGIVYLNNEYKMVQQKYGQLGAQATVPNFSFTLNNQLNSQGQKAANRKESLATSFSHAPLPNLRRTTVVQQQPQPVTFQNPFNRAAQQEQRGHRQKTAVIYAESNASSSMHPRATMAVSQTSQVVPPPTDRSEPEMRPISGPGQYSRIRYQQGLVQKKQFPPARKQSTGVIIPPVPMYVPSQNLSKEVTEPVLAKLDQLTSRLGALEHLAKEAKNNSLKNPGKIANTVGEKAMSEDSKVEGKQAKALGEGLKGTAKGQMNEGQENRGTMKAEGQAKTQELTSEEEEKKAQRELALVRKQGRRQMREEYLNQGRRLKTQREIECQFIEQERERREQCRASREAAYREMKTELDSEFVGLKELREQIREIATRPGLRQLSQRLMNQ